ncbi:MAG: hypothetical protein HY744_12575 [Deltaproteobacteria bacterium]|nr:hypothetical protein [Deltaproteobacteria bacterium]
MATLQRLLADSVLGALQAREHVLVAAGSAGALRSEFEDIIAPALAEVTPHLAAQHIDGEVTSTFGTEAADEAVERVVEQLAAQLMRSDHVDDIFADDRIIRRDGFRAIRDLLRRYAAGALEIDEAGPGCGPVEVSLAELGYVVASAARAAPAPTLRAALERAGERAGAPLAAVSGNRGRASFAAGERSAEIGLALREAITEELVDLVGSRAVELPHRDRLVPVPEGLGAQPRLAAILGEVCARTERVTGCEACCAPVDAQTLCATLTPLCTPDAERVDGHLAHFVRAIETAIADLASCEDPRPPAPLRLGAGSAGAGRARLPAAPRAAGAKAAKPSGERRAADRRTRAVLGVRKGTAGAVVAQAASAAPNAGRRTAGCGYTGAPRRAARFR